MSLIFCLPMKDTVCIEPEVTDSPLVNSIESFEEYKNDYNYEQYNHSVETNNNVPKWNNTQSVTIQNKVYKRNIKNIMLYFKATNTTKQWPEQSPYLCYWCSHSFTSFPCFIPEKFHENTFHMRGNFCSFNCALSHNFNEKTEYQTKATEMLYHLYRRIYGLSQTLIPAPSKEVLKAFGGELTIEEYRNNFNSSVYHNLVFPPMVSCIPILEEDTITNSVVPTQHVQEQITQRTNVKTKKKLVQKKIFSN